MADQAALRLRPTHLLRASARADRGLVALLISAQTILSLAALASPWLAARAVDALIDTGGSPERPFGGPDGPLPNLPGALVLLEPILRILQQSTWPTVFVGFLVSLAVLGVASAWLTDLVRLRGAALLRRGMLRHALLVGPRLNRCISAGDFATRLTINASASAGAVPAIASAAAGLLPSVGAVVVLFGMDRRIGLLVLVTTVGVSALMRRPARQTHAANQQYFAAQAEIAALLVESLTGARTTAAAGTAEAERSRVLRPLAELSRNGRERWAVGGSIISRTQLLCTVMTTSIFLVVGWRMAAGTMTIGDYLAVTGYVALSIGLIDIPTVIAGLTATFASIERCTDVLGIPATSYGTAGARSAAGTVAVRDVWVDASAGDPLHGITTTIPAGQSLALVGLPGAGHTTFAYLLGRLVEPDHGVLCLDGRALPEFSAPALHNRVGYAFARPTLLGATVADTIRLGRAAVSPADLTAAARSARAEEFISRLPNGYGNALQATPMSGGEAQRLGLARAFAHPGDVLIFDDALSSLDTATRYEVSSAIAECRDRTRIVVADHAAAAAEADRVLWFEGGAIKGDDTHAALWDQPGYRALFADAPDEVPSKAAS